jgi:hypothetical protein
MHSIDSKPAQLLRVFLSSISTLKMLNKHK